MFQKKGLHSFVILALRSLTRNLQSTGKRGFQEKPQLHIQAHNNSTAVKNLRQIKNWQLAIPCCSGRNLLVFLYIFTSS